MRVTFTFETKHQQQRETHEKRMSLEGLKISSYQIQQVLDTRVFAPWDLRTL